MLAPPEPPVRQYTDEVADSRRWEAFVPRAGDIVTTTPPKCGTTWTQAILALLISGDPEVDAQTSMKSPWIDLTFRDLPEVMARLEAQTHRRQVKSHTPLGYIPMWPDLRYIAVYRHPIDMHFSFLKHAENMKRAMLKTDVAPDPSEAFRGFLTGQIGHACLHAAVDHYKWTRARMDRENLLMLHYRDMQADLEGAVARIAAHVGISHPPALMRELTEAARFENMKRNAARFTPSAGQDVWHDEAAFFQSATSNKWEGVLTAADLAEYDVVMEKLLPPEERRWLEWGSAA